MKNNKTFSLLAVLGQCLYAAILCAVAFCQLQRSSGVNTISVLAEIPIRYLICNLLVLAALYLLVSAPWRRVCTGGIVFSVIVTVLALVNFYTLRLHGSILTAQELQNIRTAMDVMGQYNFFSPSLLPEVGIQLGTLALCLCLSFAEYRLLERSEGISVNIRRTSCALCAVALVIFLFSGKMHPYLKRARSSWAPTVTVQLYGYPVALLSSFVPFELTPPEGYDVQALSAIPMPEGESGTGEKPDIFLILNETLYDPAQVTQIQTDTPYLSGIYSLDNTLQGCAIAGAGGGTNNTEFALLTSISNCVVGTTPFNVVPMDQPSSLVSILRQQGYYTIGAHCTTGTNYNRIAGYSGLGFDEIHFGSDFQDVSIYAERPYVSDESVYDNMIRWYENAISQDQPVFAYCLTLQNHGGWDTNPSKDDLVHVENYTGSYSQEELNEYLSCISLSDQAFTKLCDYFRTVDRNVIVCMVGDHSPSFIDEITDPDLGAAAKIRQAAVPLVIWANYPLEDADLSDRSITAVGPLLLQQAGVAMPPFYQSVLELNEAFPVITDWGQCVDSSGNLLSFSDRDPRTEDIWEYLYLSYNNLLPDSLPGWFTVNNEEVSP